MKRSIEVFEGAGVDETAIEGFAAGPVHRAKTFRRHLSIFKPNYGEHLLPHGIRQTVPFDAFTVILSGDTVDFKADLDKLYVCPQAYSYNENIAEGDLDRMANYQYALKHWIDKPGVAFIKNAESGLMNDGVRGVAISVHLDDFEVWDRIDRTEAVSLPIIVATQKPRREVATLSPEDVAESYKAVSEMGFFGFKTQQKK